MLAHVFSFLPFAVWAETLRLVCQRFRGVAELGLNTALPRLARQLRVQARCMRQTLLAAVTAGGAAGRSGATASASNSGAAVAALAPAASASQAGAAAAPSSARQSAAAAAATTIVERRALVLVCRAYTAVCAARAQLDLLHAATWRYTQALRPGEAPLACFYGGRVLDNAVRVLHLSTHAPDLLGASFFRRDGIQALASGTDSCDRWRLIDDAKRFINHFERVTERAVNSRPSDWGAKAVDLLHCLVDGQRAQQSCNSSIDVSTASFRLESTWRLRRSWFLSVALNETGDVGAGGAYSWREDAGYMHLRVRRLVCAHNNHLLHPQRHARALLGPAPPDSVYPSPGCYASVYSGFGDYAGRFYYYGNMNARALRSKILHGAWPPPPPTWPPMSWHPLTVSTSFNAHATVDDNDDDDDEEELLAVLEADPEVDLNLYIKVNLQCPLRLAPYNVLRELSTEELESTDMDASAPYHLAIDIYSPENARQRLPTVFHWQMPTEVSSPPAPPPSPSQSPKELVPVIDPSLVTIPSSSPSPEHAMENGPEATSILLSDPVPDVVEPIVILYSNNVPDVVAEPAPIISSELQVMSTPNRDPIPDLIPESDLNSDSDLILVQDPIPDLVPESIPLQVLDPVPVLENSLNPLSEELVPLPETLRQPGAVSVSRPLPENVLESPLEILPHPNTQSVQQPLPERVQEPLRNSEAISVTEGQPTPELPPEPIEEAVTVSNPESASDSLNKSTAILNLTPKLVSEPTPLSVPETIPSPAQPFPDDSVPLSSPARSPFSPRDVET